ncbi:MAG: adenylate/guanylate cyclase domain-containing protein [Proteobacteria bacterium]|nr:adenylate/guanylate cyclase domain-containing protein [Pseudomonadota bacterium]
MERRLVAILAADVVGYSRLVGEDEEGTLRTLSACREVIDGLVARHHGRVFGSAGDSVIAEFASPVEAVRCAVNIQRDLETRDAGIPENKRMRFRIGVNLGDVVVDGDDLMGEGVNVAARLEGLAEPGTVNVSGSVHEQVKNKLDVGFDFLGPQELKNIAEPVPVFRVRLEPRSPTSRSAASERSPEPLALPEKRSIVVLPFENLSGDPEQGYFSDGITEDIITELSKFRSLFVIARSSSFSFRGQSPEVKEVSRRLGVRYVVEGSVRRAGNRVRITAQLIDAVADAHLWAERYDRVLEDVFTVQDEVTEAIVAAIAPELGKAEQQLASSKKLENLNVWEVYQRGMWHLYQRTKADLAEARRLFEAALSLDPGLSLACSALVDAYYYEVVLGLADSVAENRDKALQVARRAVELDPDDAAAHCAMGKARIVRREHALAVPDLQLAIDLNPSSAWAHYGLGAAAVFSGHAGEAIGHLERAIRLSPRDQHMGSFMVRLAEAYLVKRDYPGAVQWARKALQQQGFQWSRYAALLAGLGFLGEREEARRVLDECLARRPDFSVSMVRDGHLYTDAAALDHYLEGLRHARVPE